MHSIWHCTAESPHEHHHGSCTLDSLGPAYRRIGLLMASGTGAGSFSVLIGATAHRLPAEKCSFAAGLINASGSLGQFVFAPLVEWVIGIAGWGRAMFTMATTTLLSLPLACPLRRRAGAHATTVNTSDEGGLRAQLHVALRDGSYWCLHLGFFNCGLHIAFLVTHLPGEIALCGLSPTVASTSIVLIGLFNIAGNLLVGALGQRYRMKNLLF